MKTKTKTTLGFFGAGKMAEGILAAAAVVPGFDPVFLVDGYRAEQGGLQRGRSVRTAQ